MVIIITIIIIISMCIMVTREWISIAIKRTLVPHDDVIKWKHFPRYWPLVMGTTGYRWIPLTKARYAELWCFLWTAPEQTVEQTIETKVPVRSIYIFMGLCGCNYLSEPWFSSGTKRGRSRVEEFKWLTVPPYEVYDFFNEGQSQTSCHINVTEYYATMRRLWQWEG